jgi:hypothetical protein
MKKNHTKNQKFHKKLLKKRERCLSVYGGQRCTLLKHGDEIKHRRKDKAEAKKIEALAEKLNPIIEQALKQGVTIDAVKLQAYRQPVSYTRPFQG